MRAAMLAPSTPSGACSPPPSGRFPPLVCIRRVGLRFFIQLGQAREAGASGPEGKGARGACAQLWNPRPAGGVCPHLYGVGSKVVHTRARVFLCRTHYPPLLYARGAGIYPDAKRRLFSRSARAAHCFAEESVVGYDACIGFSHVCVALMLRIVHRWLVSPASERENAKSQQSR